MSWGKAPVRFRLLRPAATVAGGRGHGTVVIPAPRSLGVRAERFPGYLGTGRSHLLDRPSTSPPLRGPLPSRGWI